MDTRIALAQINPKVGDFEGNALKICQYVMTAERNRCDLIVFPELAICGYPVWDLSNKHAFVKKNLVALSQIRRATRNKRVAVAVGFIDRARGKRQKNFNAAAVLRNGVIIYKQAKKLLPTYDVFLEEIFFSPGRRLKPFNFNGMRCGLTICEDLWDDGYKEKPAQVLKRKGAQILLNLSASPYSNTKVEQRKRLVLKKAKMLGVWIVYVNQVCGQDDLIFDGRSFIASPRGQIVYEAPAFQEGLFQATINVKNKTPVRFIPKKVSDEAEIYEALKLGLRDYVRKNGFRKVVIGLSGGIDSALVAAIARDSLGSESVISVGLPGPYSSTHSLKDARALANRLGVEFRVIPIRGHYERFLHKTILEKKKRGALATENKNVSVAMENLQARLRGLQLMYISNDEGALLLTTGNKSELAMGYGTLYGDMCGGLSVIGDVYKTDVYKLVKYRNSVSSVIPKSILQKPPTAELRPNQKDEDSLPPYSCLDQILYRHVERNEGFDEIVRKLKRKGIARTTVRRVLRAVASNEYKRRQLPPALRITDKAWFGRRMPITMQKNAIA
jgi:NAD+ synthase (glutamine-hydrolysing)